MYSQLHVLALRRELAIRLKGCFDPALPDSQFNYKTKADSKLFQRLISKISYYF